MPAVDDHERASRVDAGTYLVSLASRDGMRGSLGTYLVVSLTTEFIPVIESVSEFHHAALNNSNDEILIDRVSGF